jgi:hypothetical protein
MLLLIFAGIAYMDRVNMSVAGKPIAQELALSPIALGYLFLSFLWAYVLVMLPGGPPDRSVGRACGGERRHHRLVGGADGDWCGGWHGIDADSETWSRRWRSAVFVGDVSQCQNLVAVHRTRHGHRIYQRWRKAWLRRLAPRSPICSYET